jgi:predicted 3-demethylubiquinone-9 3-methyltransferase (glyoxalase superfamily)
LSIFTTGNPIRTWTIHDAAHAVRNGQACTALHGEPVDNFSSALSIVVNCESPEEVDGLWEKLSAESTPGQCGWRSDQLGVSWQSSGTALTKP